MTRRAIYGNNPQPTPTIPYSNFGSTSLPIRSNGPVEQPEVFPIDGAFDDLFLAELPSNDYLDLPSPSNEPIDSMSNALGTTMADDPSYIWSGSTYRRTMPSSITPWMPQNNSQVKDYMQDTRTLSSLPFSPLPNDDIAQYSTALNRNANFPIAGFNYFNPENTNANSTSNSYNNGTSSAASRFSVQSSPSTLLSNSYGSTVDFEPFPTHGNASSDHGVSVQSNIGTSNDYNFNAFPNSHSFTAIDATSSLRDVSGYEPGYSNSYSSQSRARATVSTAARRGTQSSVIPTSTQEADFPINMARSNSRYPIVPGHAIVDYSPTFIKCECKRTYTGSLKNVRSNYKRHLTKRDSRCPICDKTMTRKDNVYAHVKKYHPEHAVQQEATRQIPITNYSSFASDDKPFYGPPYGTGFQS